MSIVERVVELLKQYPALKYRVNERSITVPAPNPSGFDVTLVEATGEWVVGFDGWHEHFDDEDQAVACFTTGLSDRCRLRVEYRGSFPYRWTLEYQSDDIWHEDSTTGLIFGSSPKSVGNF